MEFSQLEQSAMQLNSHKVLYWLLFKGTFSLHIRSAGNWTKKLYEFIGDKIISDEQAKGGVPDLNRPSKTYRMDGWTNAKQPSIRGRRSMIAPRDDNITVSVYYCSDIFSFQIDTIDL